MKSESRDEHRWYDTRSLLKAGALAVALAAITWLLGALCFR